LWQNPRTISQISKLSMASGYNIFIQEKNIITKDLSDNIVVHIVTKALLFEQTLLYMAVCASEFFAHVHIWRQEDNAFILRMFSTFPFPHLCIQVSQKSHQSNVQETFILRATFTFIGTDKRCSVVIACQTKLTNASRKQLAGCREYYRRHSVFNLYCVMILRKHWGIVKDDLKSTLIRMNWSRFEIKISLRLYLHFFKEQRKRTLKKQTSRFNCNKPRHQGGKAHH